MNRFSLGSSVCWHSQASGTYSTKAGVIVAVVAAGQKPSTQYRNLYRNRGVQGVQTRKTESYVVRVGKQYYWPRVNGLRPSNEVIEA